MKIIFGILIFVASLLASIDINSASAEELSSLNGIGAKKAKAIISYRDDIKCFKSIDELLNIKGIGKATLEKNKDNIIIGNCK